MKINILQGAFLPVPPSKGGAIEAAWHSLGREFAKRGHEVTHVSSMAPDLPNEETVGDVKYTRASVKKLQKLIGFKPKVSLRNGLQKFTDWYLRKN